MKGETKNLGRRRKVPVRLGPRMEEAVLDMAKLTNLPANSVIAAAVATLRATFAPLIDRNTLSLEQLEEELAGHFEEARRVVASRPAQPRKPAAR